ncbi:uncharacterized protein PGTG_03340 [Puccinia graminis f. sp. tritici CRL 75-36-700-3]|uniref:Uncharacterized protein n=1 Tax=Puccinia graminis f. sp. tritici (strain CRL 75-36-700-3 / race SCCL) TaxID=418459 RepID=E3JZA9_PUCGT|nr:uncharacterized protein PGTG_03340 [Puccinia graminis f. sp. tritici CRL 75-36-700-3]EFP77384.2 hypothetical protein PGTG_03340 [Puccinia graminis f. sp. tritici CRL 75-36-700-3]
MLESRKLVIDIFNSFEQPGCPGNLVCQLRLAGKQQSSDSPVRCRRSCIIWRPFLFGLKCYPNMSVLARPALWTEENHEFHVADCDEEKLSKMVAELQDVLDGGNTLKRPLENEHQNQQSTSMTAVDGKLGTGVSSVQHPKKRPRKDTEFSSDSWMPSLISRDKYQSNPCGVFQSSNLQG